MPSKRMHAQRWYNKGIALVNLGRFEEAVKAFKRAVEINPNYNEELYSKGIALANIDRHKEAINYLSKAFLSLKEEPFDSSINELSKQSESSKRVR